MRGTAEICAHIDGTPIRVIGLVSDHVCDMILGLDFLCDQAAVWNFDKGTVSIAGVEHQLHIRSARTWCRRVVLDEDVMLEPTSESVIFTNVVFSGRVDQVGASQWATAPCQPSTGVSVA